MDGIQNMDVYINIQHEEKYLEQIKNSLSEMETTISKLKSFELDPSGWEGSYVKKFNEKLKAFIADIEKKYRSLAKTKDMIEQSINDYKDKIDVIKRLNNN